MKLVLFLILALFIAFTIRCMVSYVKDLRFSKQLNSVLRGRRLIL